MKLALLLFAMTLMSDPPSDNHSVDFDSAIMPVLTKAGCNSGACHGAAAGRGGFRLSLLGADPNSDHEAIVFALEGRRINRVRPERSLILLKSSEQIEHGGDAALEQDSTGAKLIADWIRAGALRGSRRQLNTLEVSPVKSIVEQTPSDVPIKVMATFDNGVPEDVTAWAVLTSSDSASLEIMAANTASPVARVLRRGQHVVIARFLDRVVPIQVVAPMTETAVDHSREVRANFIDDEILKALTELRLPVSQPAEETAWLRRVTLDLAGRLPDVEIVDGFLQDQNFSKSERRERYVDQLLNNEAFADYWTLRFSRLLQMHSLPNESEVLPAYSQWLHTQILTGIPFDQITGELLTATGDSHVVGPANFSRMVNDPRDHAELVGKVFLGVRLGCANCHNHPLDRWTQDDFHGLAAVFAKLDRGREVRVTSRGAVTNLRTGEPATARIPGLRGIPADVDARAEFATWITSEGKSQLAKATVNRLWRAMFGRGLVEPPDDLRETNPATHPELLNRLTNHFIDNGFRLRETLKLIALSNTYARSSEPVVGNEIDERFYSHSMSKPLEPEVFLDAIADVTGVTSRFNGLPEGTRAVAVIDPQQPALSLDALGRCARAAGCEETAIVAGGLETQLHLLNSDLINARLIDPDGRLQKSLDAGRSAEQIVHDFYRRAYCREPSDSELQLWMSRLTADSEADRRLRLEDFVWSLLNSGEFRQNR